MFETIEKAPEDPIFGLMESFAKDPNPEKINLVPGIYQDDLGRTPILQSVKNAEKIIFDTENSKNYLGILGDPDFRLCVQKLLFGDNKKIINSGKVDTAHCPGGTGALRLAAEFIKRISPNTKIWISDPTWANHPNVFKASSLAISSYPYYDFKNKTLAFDAMLNTLKNAAAGDVILLHACCHNPSGMDLNPTQWSTLAELFIKHNLIPLFDFAYQGFGKGIDEDAYGIRLFTKLGCELIIANSFSKNFGLYNERIGALTMLGHSKEHIQKAFSQIKQLIRSNYSNPPAHGARIVTTILTDEKLRNLWYQEVELMRSRIIQMREQFVEILKKNNLSGFDFIKTQRGLFSFLNLTQEQIEKLKVNYSIYMVNQGRINLAAINKHNIERLGACLSNVLNQ